MKNTILTIIHFFCFWLWIDFSRLFRKSHGILGYIGSLRFYWNVHKQFNLPYGQYYNPKYAITIIGGTYELIHNYIV